MASDPGLVERLRGVFHDRRDAEERRMFGGVCFMVGGNMAVGVHNQDLIIRIGKIQADALMTEPHVRPMNVTGKVMKEWALVQPDGVRRDEDLRRYVLMGYAFARTLPRK